MANATSHLESAATRADGGSQRRRCCHPVSFAPIPSCTMPTRNNAVCGCPMPAPGTARARRTLGSPPHKAVRSELQCERARHRLNDGGTCNEGVHGAPSATLCLAGGLRGSGFGHRRRLQVGHRRLQLARRRGEEQNDEAEASDAGNEAECRARAAGLQRRQGEHRFHDGDFQWNEPHGGEWMSTGDTQPLPRHRATVWQMDAVNRGEPIRPGKARGPEPFGVRASVRALGLGCDHCYGAPEPFSGHVGCSALPMPAVMREPSRDTRGMRASIGVKRLFMSTPPRR